MSKNEYDNIINSASKMLNIDEKDIIKAKEENNVNAILKNVSKRDSEKIQNILSNPEATKRILESEEAKAIINKLINR